MDIEYLNLLGDTFLVHGPNAMDIGFLNELNNNDFRAQNYDALQSSSKVNDFRLHNYDSLQPSTSAYVDLGPDAIELTGATIYTGYAPDTSEWTG